MGGQLSGLSGHAAAIAHKKKRPGKLPDRFLVNIYCTYQSSEGAKRSGHRASCLLPPASCLLTPDF